MLLYFQSKTETDNKVVKKIVNIEKFSKLSVQCLVMKHSLTSREFRLNFFNELFKVGAHTNLPVHCSHA